MKKLLGIIFCSFFITISASSDERTNLICVYVETYYQDWDEGKFGQSVTLDDAQKSINFSILRDSDNYGFDTNKLGNWEWVKNVKSFDDIVSDGEYKFIAVDGVKYMLINLNRFDGNLEFILGYTNDDNKYQWKETFSCEKAKAKF
tara:strand:- start:65 stop:502 length:438 start_codon:yes stop_codon:yes gene_type:complete